jgi:hypothetical protein
MSMLKYIRLATRTFPALMIFPSYLSHAEAAAGREVRSAGFVDEHEWICHGESTSLQVASDPADTALLRSMFGVKPQRAEPTCDTCGRWDSGLVDGMCQECRRRLNVGHGGACCGGCSGQCSRTQPKGVTA